MEYRQKSIKSWAADDRPREKFIGKGHRSLSDSELLAILLRSGNQEMDAVELAKVVLDSVGNNWNNLSKLTIGDLCKFKGIGEVKAVTIIAALEIGRRKASQELPQRPHIRDGKSTFELMQPIVGDLNIEEFWALFLNQKNLVIRKERISSGGITQTVVDSRVIFKIALQEAATGIILVHNHPSGNTRPSDPDKTLTQKLKAAGKILDIEILDHVIITQKSYFSFAEEGVL